MPIYEYVATSGGCPTCDDGIECLQKMADPPLEACPDCGAPLTRVIGAPSVATGGSHLLRESHLSKNGFTQYRKVGKGKYEKTAGRGPATISEDG